MPRPCSGRRRPQRKNARILIATYQTLGRGHRRGRRQLPDCQLPEDYFSHIIIDECHRSAWGKWSQVLTRNPNAVQIGLTATPRQFEYHRAQQGGQRPTRRSPPTTSRYFGEPVYEYDMAQGIEDGYLAACEIRQGPRQPGRHRHHHR